MPSAKKPFYGWKLAATFFGIGLINFAFPFYGGSLINVYMAEALGFSRTLLGSAVTVFMFTIGLAAVLAGYIVERFSIKMSILLGITTLMVTALLMSTVVANAWQFVLVFGVIGGTGSALANLVPIQTGINLWFRQRKAMVIAIVMCAAGVGAMIVTPLVQWVIDASSGDWRAAWLLILAALCISWLLSALFIVNRPEDIGQKIDGGDDASKDGEVPSASKVYKTLESWTLKEALSSRTYWILVYASVAFILVFNLAVAHGVAHLRDQGIDPDLAALSLGLLVLFSIIGRLAAGVLGDRIELRFIWAIAISFCAAGILLLLYTDTSSAVYLYCLLTGVGFGASFVASSALVGNYFGQEAFASLYGISSAFAATLGATSPLLAGLIYDASGSYQAAIYVVALIAALAAVLTPFATPPVKAR